MIADLRNPFRRALLLASLEEIDSDEVMLIKYLDERFKFLVDHITDMADLIGTSNVNVHRGKGQRAIRSLFQRRRRMLEDKSEESAKFIPRVGKVKIVPMEYD